MQKFLLLLLLLVAVGLADHLSMFASVVPIQTFVEEICGQHMDATLMDRPVFDPHT